MTNELQEDVSPKILIQVNTHPVRVKNNPYYAVSLIDMWFELT